MAPCDNILDIIFWFPWVYELAMVHIVGSVEDEKCLSTLAFMKSIHNCLTTHLPIVVHMFAQQFYSLHNSLCVWNVLNSGEQHIINLAMMVNLQRALWSLPWFLQR
jgi:hypothetical protein